MKTRDELAEAFAEAFILSSTGGYSAHADVIAKQAFACADAFVAERERRARPTPVDEATLRLNYSQANVIALALGYDGRSLPLDAVVEKIRELASLAPAETPAAEALKFSPYYVALGADGKHLTLANDGVEATADDGLAIVRIRATDRAHAERIVAAMLPVGRGTK